MDAPIRIWELPDGNIAVLAGRNDTNYTNILYHLNPAGGVVAQYDMPALLYQGVVEPQADGSFVYSLFGDVNGVPAYLHTRMSSTGLPLDTLAYASTILFQSNGWVIKSTPDGGFVIAFGIEAVPPGQGSVRVVKVNAQGNIVYNKSLSAEYPFLLADHLAVLPNGRVVVYIEDFSQGNRLVCLGPTGTTLWTKGTPQANPYNVGLQAVGADKVVCYGTAATPVEGFAAVYGPTGAFAWNRTFTAEAPSLEIGGAITDGDFVIIAGEYLDDDIGLATIKIAPDGQTVFAKKFTHLSGHGMKSGMSKNGDYVFSGFRWIDIPFGYQSDAAYALCLQADGTFNWFAANDSFETNLMIDFCHTQNGDMFFAGRGVIEPAVNQNFDNLLIKVSDIGPVYSQLLQGNILRDSIENCEAEPVEPRLDGWVVKAETAGGNRYGVSDATGKYGIRLNADNASLSVSMPNDLWQPCQPSYPIALTGVDTAMLDIPVRQVAQCPVLRLDATAPLLRRCFDNTYYLNWCNYGTATAENAVLTVVMDGFTEYAGSSLPLAAQNGQELSFQLGNLPTGQCGDMTLTIHLSCDAELGQMHCLDARIEAVQTCPDYPGNIVSDRNCQVNVGSFDPNDKRAFVSDTLREGHILPNTAIEYQIRFQNTGTDTAFNIVVVDTIANTLDINTLRTGASSHPFTLQLHGSNVVKFVFNNIQLPDSNINEAASHGFVQFSIAQKPDLPLLTEIRNKADIYFDYNLPVATNRHKLVVNKSSAAPAPPDALDFVEAYPNPAEDGLFWLESRDPARNIRQVSVFDAAGRLLLDVHPLRNKVRLELPDAKGVYLVTFGLDDGRKGTVRIVR